MRPSETPLDRLFGIAFTHRPTAEKLAQFPTEYLPDDYHVLQQAMQYQLANTNGDYGFTRRTLREYLDLKQVGTPAYRAALLGLHNRCNLGGTPTSKLSSEVPVLLDRITQEGKLQQGKKKLAEKNVAAALPLLREGGLDPRKIARLQRVFPEAVELVEVDWDTVTGEEVWLWDKKIPSEAITLIAGEGGLGKSTTAVDLAASVSTGRLFPDGSPAPLGDVIYFSAEDAQKIIKKRLVQQGADLKRIHSFEGYRVGEEMKYFDLADLHVLDAAMAKYPQTKLLIIDPVASYVSHIDSHKNADVRRVMAPLAKFAEQHHLAVILIIHLNKDNSKSASNRITGSGAWRDLARAAWFVVENRAMVGQRLFLHDKASYGPKSEGYSFTMDDGILRWGGTSTANLDEMLAHQPGQRKTDDAVDWLKEQLKDGPKDSAVIMAAGEKAGITRTTLWRAKDTLKVQTSRRGFGKDGTWTWSLLSPERELGGTPTGESAKNEESPF